MVNIPKNNSDELIAKQEAAHQKELDTITKQILAELKKYDYAEVCCSEHMIGYGGSTRYHHLCDTVEVAKQFKAQGYYCYYYDFYNNHGVNQRAVLVRKAPMPESEITRGSRTWYRI